MKTVLEKKTHEIEIKNSRFITILYPITEQTNILNIIEDTKKLYPKANHYCFAYLTDTKQKSSDDGEPSGTAGIPMLNVLIKEKLINTLAITIRYFGGIKLGAGGLVRAYTKSVKEALTVSQIIEVEKGYHINITIPYSEQKNLDYLLKDSQIINKNYQEAVNYEVLINKKLLPSLKNYTCKITSEEYIRALKD